MKGSADLQSRASTGNTFCDLNQVCQESLNQQITKLKAGATGNQKGAQEWMNSVPINLIKNKWQFEG